MKLETLVLGAFRTNVYLLYGETFAMVLDPGAESEKILNFLKEKNLKLEIIAITHGHLDHIGGITPLIQEFQPKVYMSSEDRWLYESISEQAEYLGLSLVQKELPKIDWETASPSSFHFLDSEFQILFTPGHTPGSLCYYDSKNQRLFTGDTLFYRTIGRSDLPGGDSEILVDSIQNILFPLPSETQVYPGHMQKSSIGEEKLYNPFLQGIS